MSEEELYFNAILEVYQININKIINTESNEDDSLKDSQLEDIICDLACDDLKELPAHVSHPYFDDLSLWQEAFLQHIRKQQENLKSIEINESNKTQKILSEIISKEPIISKSIPATSLTTTLKQ